MSKRRKPSPERPPLKLLLWTAVAGLIFGLIGFGEIAEDWLRVGRNSLHPHRASGQVVIVKIDDASLKQYGNWPWPRRLHRRPPSRSRRPRPPRFCIRSTRSCASA